MVMAAGVVPARPTATAGWDEFVARWAGVQDRLFRIALLIARDRPEAEDAVADALAATYGPWRDGRVQSLEAYARTAVVNRLTGRGRRRSVARRHDQRRSGDDRGVRLVADDVVERDEVRRALLRLPTRQRAVVVLRFYGELSVRETAEALGCSEGTVKSQVHDALAALRAHLQPTDTEETGR